jgi:hypothetical protein
MYVARYHHQALLCHEGRVQWHAARPDPTRPDPTRPDPTRPDPTRPDPTRPAPTRPRLDPTPADRAGHRAQGAGTPLPWGPPPPVPCRF